MAIEWTDQQRQAITTVDRSVLVSAAAGSGKTAVLAARCVYLVCDAPEAHRCDIDQILVVTFTEAAAAEMRTRIVNRLRERAAENPDDHRARQQAALVDTAQIGTIHAFCLSLIRDWFHRVDVDATAQMLDADEAEQLRAETLERLFDQRYRDEGDIGQAFKALIDTYGANSDRNIARMILKIANLCDSLIDPDAWLARTADPRDERFEEMMADAHIALGAEIARQSQDCRTMATAIGRRFPVASPLAIELTDLAESLATIEQAASVDRQWDQVRESLRELERNAPRQPSGLSDAEKERWQKAKNLHKDCKDSLKKIVSKGLTLFTEAELRDGWTRTAPFVGTLADLTRAFRTLYDAAKRERGLMDFSDLERLAHRLLTETLEGESESPVARQLRTRFAHLLVDEFQDVNPLQARIIHQASRESLEHHPGNLFAVGDVKQSIYRFRLAEPRMFTQRRREHGSEDSPHRLIAMQTNFRSTPRLINAINALFAALMTGETDDVGYDESAHMIPAQTPNAEDEPCELHLLEQTVTPDDDDAKAHVDPDDPAQWGAAEREAFLIGQRIRELKAAGFTVRDGENRRRLRYGDVGILLRAARHVAARMSRMLASIGIPARVDAGQDIFEATEVRGVLALLTVIDNPRQDIELAAVLRSGVLGDRFSEDELLAMRIGQRGVPFHQAVFVYARRGADLTLTRRLRTTLRRVRAYRRRARVEPVADIIWSLLTETAYLGYVGGLRDGDERRANLIALHDWARSFGAFRRQGLSRFLRFLDRLRQKETDASIPSPAPAAQDAVRIMSVHRAKGLEFPVVFVAELGRKFNRSDAQGCILIERDAGIGPKAVDAEKLITYPTIAHHQCARRTLEGDMSEDLRLLYVALSRARQKLILVGTQGDEVIEKWSIKGQAQDGGIGGATLAAASNPLHWIVAAIASLPPALRTRQGASTDETLFVIHRHDADAIRDWSRHAIGPRTHDELLRRVAAGQPLPADEPVSRDLSPYESIVDRLTAGYPHLGVTSVRSAISASQADRITLTPAGADDDDQPRFAPPRSRDREAVALRRGNATHRVLQWIDLTGDDPGFQVDRTVDMLVSEEMIESADADLIDRDALRWFLESPLADRARAALNYHREWMFLSSVPVDVIDAAATNHKSDRVLVRGVVDGIIERENALCVIDFKTDVIAPDQARQRAEKYATQVDLYARAASQAFGKPIESAHLVFLAAREVVDVDVAV